VIAVVLVGGTGTRLRPITADRPKPMVPIAGRPFLAHLLAQLDDAGVRHVIFSCGYLPDAIRRWFGDGSPGGPRITYVVEEAPLGTAGAIRLAADGRVDEPFLALNGDVLAELDLLAFRRFHEQVGSRATIALTPVAEPERYGLVLTDARGAVVAFREKPGAAELADVPGPYRINAGAYVLDPDVLAGVPAGRAVSIEREVFPGLVGHGLHAWDLTGYWNDIGTPESYLAANRHVVRAEVGDDVRVDPTAVVHPDAELVAPARIGPDAVVEGGARVGDESVVGAGARVESGAHVLRSVLHERAHIGPGARVHDSVVGTDALVGAGAELRDLVVVGPGVRITPGAVLAGERLAREPVDAGAA
jgi:mannose-1-phosphate guanylyltransferase